MLLSAPLRSSFASSIPTCLRTRSLQTRSLHLLVAPRPSIRNRTIQSSSTMSDFVPPPIFSSDQRSASTSSSGGAPVDSSASDRQTKVLTHNQYQSSGLDTKDLLPSPLALFQKWFDLVSQPDSPVQVNEPEAMLLCTSSLNPSTGMSIPSSRVVLLKSIHPKEGLTFYSNYTSRKAQEIQSNPYVSCTFYWRETSQSVRFVGKARKITQQESQEYFDSRPIGSRIGAWASPQSQGIQSRSELEDKVTAKENEFNVPGAAGLKGAAASEDKNQFKDVRIPLPDHWGGYRIEPFEVEFWCGRPNRLHDRFRYTRSQSSTKPAGEDQWDIQRLAP
ncbi:unnamed protein product [Sympodiomycopsis kandeliae]